MVFEFYLAKKNKNGSVEVENKHFENDGLPTGNKTLLTLGYRGAAEKII